MPKSKDAKTMPKSSSERILKEISKELVHLENMLHRVQGLSTKNSHQSYIERIMLRIDYTKRAYKDLRERVMFEDAVEEIHKENRYGREGERNKS